MAQGIIRLYGSSAILRRLLTALIWGGVTAYLVYIMVEVRPARISLATEPPAVVSLADFSRRADLHERNEVNVIGRIDSRDGVPVGGGETSEQLFFFFAPGSDLDDTVVRAAVLIGPEDLQIYLKELAANPDDNQVRVNGRVLQLPKNANSAQLAIEKRGFTLSDHFVYITPWLGDRRDPLDDGPWFDLVLISLSSLAVLYQLFMALRWYRNDRAVMDMMSDEQIAAYKRRMWKDVLSWNTLSLLIIAIVVIAFVVNRYR